jgi:hypothetical protein
MLRWVGMIKLTIQWKKHNSVMYSRSMHLAYLPDIDDPTIFVSKSQGDDSDDETQLGFSLFGRIEEGINRSRKIIWDKTRACRLCHSRIIILSGLYDRHTGLSAKEGETGSELCDDLRRRKREFLEITKGMKDPLEEVPPLTSIGFLDLLCNLFRFIVQTHTSFFLISCGMSPITHSSPITSPSNRRSDLLSRN